MNGLPIIMESDDGALFAVLDSPEHRVTFHGGDFGQAYWAYHTAEYASPLVAHFEAYCRASNKRPAFHRWCRRLVASDLAMTLRNLAVDPRWPAGRTCLRNNPTPDVVATELEESL